MPSAFDPPQHNYDRHLRHWASLSFEQYCQVHRQLIATLRHEHQMDTNPQSIAFNAPYSLMPSPNPPDHAVMLIHGFIASPYYLHAIAQVYAQLGLGVYNLTLPGHGTCPGDLLNCRAQHWIDYARLMLDKINARHRHVHLCGHSMGAVIANLLATEQSVCSLVELVPAHGVNLTGALQIAVSYVMTHGLRWQLWRRRRAETNQAAYRSVPVRAYQQVVRLIHQLPPTPSCPLFGVASAEDATVAANKTYRRYQAIENASLYWYQCRPGKITDPSVQVVDSSALADDIAELSHLAVTLPQSDSYFGRNGSYYQGEQTLWGEYGGGFAKQAHFKRLTFNPDFANMTDALQDFIGRQI